MAARRVLKEMKGANLDEDSGIRLVATRAYGDLLQMGVIDPAKVTRLALQNAGSIAGLVLSVDCLIANAPKPKQGAGEGAMAGAESPEF